MAALQVNEGLIERATASLLVAWLAKKLPNVDLDATLLRELGSSGEHGLQLSVGNKQFRITVEAS